MLSRSVLEPSLTLAASLPPGPPFPQRKHPRGGRESAFLLCVDVISKMTGTLCIFCERCLPMVRRHISFFFFFFFSNICLQSVIEWLVVHALKGGHNYILSTGGKTCTLVQEKNYILIFKFFATVTMTSHHIEVFVYFVFHVKQYWASLK